MFADFVGGPMDGKRQQLQSVRDLIYVSKRTEVCVAFDAVCQTVPKPSFETIRYVLHIHTDTFAVYVDASSELANHPVNEDVVTYFAVQEEKLERHLSAWAKASTDCQSAALSTLFCFSALVARRHLAKMKRLKRRPQ